MKLYTTRYEPNKGYIPADKVTVSNTRYENYSFSNLSKETYAKFNFINEDYRKDVYTNNPKKYAYELEHITLEAIEELKAKYDIVVKDIKYFYYNFNHDGIQAFINRTI